MATPRLFQALRIPLKRGRLIDETDAAGRPFVAVINETAAGLYWPGEDPIGKAIRYYPPETNPSIRSVGIVGDVRSLGAAVPAPPAVYASFEQAPRPPIPGRNMTFVVRVPGNPVDVVASARAAVASIDSGLPLANVRPMAEIVAASAGNAAAVDTTERFPPRLGNLAGEREIPTFPPPIIALMGTQERTEDWTASTRSGTLTAGRRAELPGERF